MPAHAHRHEEYPRVVHSFVAVIWKKGILRCVDIPRRISVQLGKGPHIPVCGEAGGLPFRSTLAPRGGGKFLLVVHSRIWRRLGLDAGDSLEVTLWVDLESREPVLPADVAAALASTPRALAQFRKFSTAVRREIVNHIEAIKRPETRARKIPVLISRILSDTLHGQTSKSRKGKKK